MSTPPPGVAQQLQSARLSYPGMLPREILVFQRWLTMHEAEYTSFQFNVRLGNGVDPGPELDANIRQAAIMNSQKRVDVVAWLGQQPIIIEVKDRATASAIGQIASYAALWAGTFPNTPAPALRLVCNRLDPDILAVCQFHGINVDVVPTDFSALRGKGSAVQG